MTSAYKCNFCGQPTEYSDMCSDCFLEISREVDCPTCGGTGDAEILSEYARCQTCNGTGKVRTMP